MQEREHSPGLEVSPGSTHPLMTLHGLRVKSKEEQVQVEIQAEIEFEAQLDAMNEDEANAHAR